MTVEQQITLVGVQEIPWRSNPDLVWTLKTKVVLVAELQLLRQQGLPVLATRPVEQVVNIGETALCVELVQLSGRDGLDGCDHLGDAEGLGEGEEGGVGALDHRQDALLDHHLVRGERLRDGFERRSCQVERCYDCQSWKHNCLRRSFEFNSWSGGQDVLRSWDGGSVKERSVLQHAAGGGWVDQGGLDKVGGQAARWQDLDGLGRCPRDRDVPRALPRVLHVKRVRGADGGDLR